MSCRWTYKTYELTGKKPSRQKKYYHKKRNSKITQEGPSFEPTQELAEEQQADNSGPGPVDQTQATAGPECSDTPTDTSTDDEVSVEPPKHKKKRKVKTSGKSEDEPFPLSSDDPFSSDTASESEQPHSLINAEPQTLPRQVAALQANQIFDADSSDDCQENVGSNSNGKEGEPLCNCTKTTVGDVMFMTLALGLRHGLSWDAQVDILKMISTVFVDKKIPLSKNTYISKLQAMEDSDIEYHVYCKKCDTYMGKRDACERFCHDCHKVYTNTSESEIVESCEDCHILLGERQVKAQVRYCSNKTCGAEIKFAAADNLLISVSIESQLQKFVKDENFVNNVMQYRFNRQYIPGVYSDVYDGAMYQKHFVNNGILSSPYNFSYTFFADGIPYSKSGQKTVWPIYLTINELPYEERRKYYILAAVYCGDKEPNEQWFFPAFVKQANHLSMNGFQWNHNGKSVTSRVLPLCLVADSGARHKLINMQSYGAIYGCTFCYIETEKI
ncbi:hypothetical protein FOCC_FOCC017206, partial [Frankliniella occidentalis]